MTIAKGMLVSLVILLVSTMVSACSSAPAPAPSSKPAESAKPAADKPAVSDATKKIVDAARQEKEVIWQVAPGTSMSEQEAARKLEAIVKKYFDVDISIKTDSTLPYTGVAPRLIAEAQTNTPPSWDLIYQVDNTIAALYPANLLEQVNWPEVASWIKKDDAFYQNRALVVGSMSVTPAYNTKLVQKTDLPKKWSDLADPKWKGKMISTIYQTPFIRVAQPDLLGEAKALDLIQKLGTQGMAFGRYPDMHTRLVAGEFSIATTQISPYIVEAKRAGAPADEAILDEPMFIMEDLVAIPVKAAHPNAAKLVAAALVTDEGQKLWWDAYGRSSLHRPNTPINEWAKGKKYSLPDMDFMIKNANRLDKQYTEILIKK